MTQPDWIGAEWVQGQLRVWAIAGGQPVRQAVSEPGLDVPTRDTVETALLALAGDWLAAGRATPVIISGLAADALRAVPCTPLPEHLTPLPARDARLSLHLVAGLKQDKPAGLMQGAETRIAGFLARNPGWDGVVCLPGDAGLWAHLSAGEVVSFQSFMTAEIFAHLSGQSGLHLPETAGDEAGFGSALAQGMERPEWLLARLASIRAEQQLQGRAPAEMRARLAGLLIGAELAAAKPYWLGQRVALIGAGAAMAQYGAALNGLSVPVSQHDATAMTLAGLSAAREKLA